MATALIIVGQGTVSYNDQHFGQVTVAFTIVARVQLVYCDQVVGSQ